MELRDPQNRDLRRNSPTETEKLVGLLSPPVGVNQRTHTVITIHVHIGVVKSGRHDRPSVRKSSIDDDSGGKIGGWSRLASDDLGWPRMISVGLG